MTKITVKEVPMKKLVENDYNPRKTFGDAKMKNLKESIQRIGLLQSLAVREIDGEYEVVGGMRRFRALKDLDWDDDVPINVIDADKGEAKLIALSENLEREELTPMEEAEAFAEYVDVQVSEDLVGEMEKQNYKTKEKDISGRTQYYANFKDYLDYLHSITNANNIKTPGHESSSIEKASETIPGATPNEIANRVKLLFLPEELQNDIDNRQLTQETALQLVRLKELGDVEEMHEKMLELGRKEKYRGDGRNVDDLKETIEKISEEREEEKEIEADQSRGWVKNAIDRREEVMEKFEKIFQELPDLRKSLEELEEEETEEEEIKEKEAEEEEEREISFLEKVEQLRKELKECQIDARELDETNMDKKIKTKERKIKHIETTVETMKKKSLNECPYCHSSVTVPTLEDEINKFESNKEMLESEQEEASKIKQDVREKKEDLEEKKGKYTDILETLLEQKVFIRKELEKEDEEVAKYELNKDLDEETILEDDTMVGKSVEDIQKLSKDLKVWRSSK